MTIEDSLRAIVREEMRPVEVKLSLVASLLQQLCNELDQCRISITSYATFHRRSGDFYVGARSSIDPHRDKYMGSGAWVRNQVGLEKEVLRICDTRFEADLLETQLISALRDNPEMESHDDIMAVRFVALNRDEPLPVDPPDEMEIAFPSGQGRWLLEKIRRRVN
jgi:hypothetical protein